MTEPTIAPMPTTLTPAVATAPLADAPAPVTAPVDEQPAVRGRVASPRTVMIRAMLDDTDGEITFSTAIPILQKAGFDVDQNTFNVTKSAWKRAKHPEAVNHPTVKVAPKAAPKAKAQKPVKVVKVVKGRKVQLPEVTVADAVAFVSDAGGLRKAEKNVLRGRACLKAFKLFAKQTARLAA